MWASAPTSTAAAQLVGWRDAAESANLTVELSKRGYDASEIAALWGGNFLRLLTRAEELAA